MKTIYKYEVFIDDTVQIAMPVGAVILTVQLQGRYPQVWAVVDPDAPLMGKTFHWYGTGHPLPDDINKQVYVGTIQMGLVFHLFYE